MGKKVREYKSGDFIFAKVKGYPAWPARVQRLNGKKYFVYFYGTGETANLPPNMIFDYAENKDKFLTKTVKRKVFNDGVKQIEYDFKNNVPLEQVVGIAGLFPEDTTANDGGNEPNDILDDSTTSYSYSTVGNDTIADDSPNTTQNDTGVDESDENAGLFIDEVKKGRKSTPKVATPARPVKEPKTPRGKAKKDESREDEEEKEKKEEEVISRSGRKIRPKRYMDDQIEENTPSPSPAPKKRRAVSPIVEKEKERDLVATREKSDKSKHFNSVTQLELDVKEQFSQEDAEKDNILITYLPSGQYVGIRLFQSRPTNFKNDIARLNWYKQAASNAITLKLQLERGQITYQSVLGQLVMDLYLTDEERAALDKERETEQKKSRVQFLKTEMKIIELDAKIKTCLSMEKADTELCLKLLDELMELDIKPLILLKHPTCLETVKRMRAYIGNTSSWDLSESAALQFSKQAHRIRKQADNLYKNMTELFATPEGLSFWEYFSERVLQFKKVTSKLTSDEMLEMVHEPLEMSLPTSHTMNASVEAANEVEAAGADNSSKKKNSSVKSKKPNGTPSKPVLKRQSSRKQQQEEMDTSKNKDVEDDALKEKSDDVITRDQDGEKDKNPISEEGTGTEESEELNENTEAAKDQTQKNAESEKIGETQETSPEPNAYECEESPKAHTEQNIENEDNTEEATEKVTDKEKDKQEIEEPRAKRSRESKKTEAPPPRSPTKRKSKF